MQGRLQRWKSRLGLPLEGGPGVAGVCALGIAAACGAGRLGWLGALALSIVVLWSMRRGWRQLAAAETMAARLAHADAVAPVTESLARIETRIAPAEHRLADRHPVTGLAMREQLFATIERDAGGPDTEPTSLGVLRFANFDRLAGFDQLVAEGALAALAGRLRAAIRPDHFLAQIDRDCFAIWLRGASSGDALLAEFRALAFVAEQEVDVAGTTLRPNIECAIVAWADGGGTPATLLARGLAALAPGGPAGTVVAAPLSTAEVRERFVIERDLGRAIERSELALVFQPVVDIVAGQLVGAEALLRWTHPDLGPVSPARFIPIMETTGLSDLFGMWVLNAAAREARRWSDTGLHGLKMAVNLSARQFLDPSLAAKIVRTIERHRIAPAAIELELTETAAMADARHTARVFAELRAAGMTLAIDDFGAGYSSLSYLKNLPFDKLKIDREFVTDVQHRRDSRAICRALIELGRGLDLNVLAEGVECEEEVATLRDLGCRLFQGYHFARPMPGDAFLERVRDPAWIATLASPARHRFDRLESRVS